jgi:hypothetical protein
MLLHLTVQAVLSQRPRNLLRVAVQLVKRTKQEAWGKTNINRAIQQLKEGGETVGWLGFI